jgi:hypothetical protein
MNTTEHNANHTTCQERTTNGPAKPSPSVLQSQARALRVAVGQPTEQLTDPLGVELADPLRLRLRVP